MPSPPSLCADAVVTTTILTVQTDTCNKELAAARLSLVIGGKAPQAAVSQEGLKPRRPASTPMTPCFPLRARKGTQESWLPGNISSPQYTRAVCAVNEEPALGAVYWLQVHPPQKNSMGVSPFPVVSQDKGN